MALTQISTQGIKDGTITGSDLATNVDLVDNQKLRLGNSQDLQIFHDGSNSFINEVGTGGLFVRAQNTFNLQKAGTSEFMLKATTDGAVELYHDNSKKFATFSNGSTVFGDFFIDNQTNSGKDLFFDESGNILKHFDGVKSVFGDGNDLQIYHDGSHSRLVDSGTGFLVVQSSRFQINNADNTENMAAFIENGAVELYHDNSKKFETTSGGSKVTGNFIVNSGHISIDVDNKKLLLGANDDLEIYHNGANNIIDSNTGNLEITSDSFFVNNAANNEVQIKAVANGAVELYFNNSKKFETNGSGCHVTGSLTADTVAVQDNEKFLAGNNDDLEIYHNGTRSEILNNTGDFIIQASANNKLMLRAQTGESHFIGYHNAQVELYHDGSKKFETLSNGARVQGGLLFGSDTADANALDDYEEGYWSPVAVDGKSLSVTSGTSNHASRRYIKIGKMVTAWFDITWSSSNSSANFKTRFSGLPFSPESNTKRAHAVTFGIFTGDNSEGEGLVANINEDTGLVEFFKDGDELYSYSASAGDRIAGFVTYTSSS